LLSCASLRVRIVSGALFDKAAKINQNASRFWRFAWRGNNRTS